MNAVARIVNEGTMPEAIKLIGASDWPELVTKELKSEIYAGYMNLKEDLAPMLDEPVFNNLVAMEMLNAECILTGIRAIKAASRQVA